MFMVDVVPPSRCYNLFYFVVVILLPHGWCYSLLFFYVLADVFPYFAVTDGIATIFGRCCAKWWCITIVFVAFLAAVIAKVAYDIASKFDDCVWQMLLPGGCYYCHFSW